MIKSLFLSAILFTGLPASAQGDAHCPAKGNPQIIEVFNTAKLLNARFKASLGRPDEGEYQRLRKEVEQYGETTVMPCVSRAAQRMVNRADPRLMHGLMELLVSYENSADETMSYSMGKLFAADPAAVERALKAFSPSERKLISNSIQAGWINVKLEYSSALGKNREERLKELLSSVDRSPGPAQ
jgi:DNA invertase Pin-like site-specific DNA recombinase